MTFPKPSFYFQTSLINCWSSWFRREKEVELEGSIGFTRPFSRSHREAVTGPPPGPTGSLWCIESTVTSVLKLPVELNKILLFWNYAQIIVCDHFHTSDCVCVPLHWIMLSLSVPGLLNCGQAFFPHRLPSPLLVGFVADWFAEVGLPGRVPFSLVVTMFLIKHLWPL